MVQAHCVQTQARLAQAPRKRGVFLCLDFVWRSKGGTPFFIPGRNLAAKLGSPGSHQNGSQKGGTPFFYFTWRFHLEDFFWVTGRTRSTRNGTRTRGGTPFFVLPGEIHHTYPVAVNERGVPHFLKQRLDSQWGGTLFLRTAPGFCCLASRRRTSYARKVF